MMLEPSIDSLLEKIHSKYTLVTLSAKRAREMQENGDLLISNPKSHKFVGKALEEIHQDKLNYTSDIQD